VFITGYGSGPTCQVVRYVGHRVAVEAKELGSRLDRVGDQAAGDHADLVEARQRTIKAGLRSMRPLWMARASS
jgi:hypothetical protein